MTRLIDANEAKAFAAECWPKPEYRIAIDALLDNCPTIDPVHAAGACYCRECTCWNRHDDILPDCRFPDWGYCSKMLDSDSEIEITTLENDFCSRGQRLEED